MKMQMIQKSNQSMKDKIIDGFIQVLSTLLIGVLCSVLLLMFMTAAVAAYKSIFH